MTSCKEGHEVVICSRLKMSSEEGCQADMHRDAPQVSECFFVCYYCPGCGKIDGGFSTVCSTNRIDRNCSQQRFAHMPFRIGTMKGFMSIFYRLVQDIGLKFFVCCYHVHWGIGPSL